MKKNMTFGLRIIALVICAALSAAGFYNPGSAKVFADGTEELRGVWVSTVGNIDYPSSQTTNPDTLKSEMARILDNCKAMGFNAVFFQVRPCGDAFYKSSIFPWSKYLTGTQGLAPDEAPCRPAWP